MSDDHGERARVLILGGGFAGLAAALAIRSDRFAVTLVDRRRAFEFLPNIHELLSGVKSPELLRLPLDEAMQRAGHRFIRDTVTAIDPEEASVSLRRRRAPIGYDALIVAFGGIDATRGVPGVEEHALPFKSVDECARIGDRLAHLARRKRGGDVVVVGGGLEGVEALGEILRAWRESALRVHLVEARERLMPDAPASLDAHVRELCAPFDVSFHMGSPVERIEEQAVVLRDGQRLHSDLTIWTGGPAPPPLLAESGLAEPGEWAPVRPTLQSARHANVFVAGDSADPPERIAKQGYHALDMGACAARNAQRLLEGRRLVDYAPSGKPALVSFGDLTCFLVVDDRALAGPALAAAKEAVFELVMAQLDARPARQRVPRAIERAHRAVRSLLWPNVSSPSRLLAQGRISLL